MQACSGKRGRQAKRKIVNEHVHLLKVIADMTGVDCAALFMFCEREGRFDLVSHFGLSSSFVEANNRNGLYPACVEHVRNGRTWGRNFLDLMREYGNDHVLMEGIRSILAVPVQKDGRVIGSLQVASRTQSMFAPQTVDAVEAVAARLEPVVQLLRPI